MHKLTVTLKQHTPLIHFQHDQEGATLRASEVKPKLDRFIISKLSDDEKKKGKKEGWIKEKDGKCWLDYKMRIVAEGKPDEYLIASLLHPQAREHSIFILNETPYFAQEAINVSKKAEEYPVFLKNGNGRDATYTFNRDNWDSIDKKGLMWGKITLSVFSLSNELLSIIDKNLASFLFVQILAQGQVRDLVVLRLKKNK